MMLGSAIIEPFWNICPTLYTPNELENEKYLLYWNIDIVTNRSIQHICRDITLLNKLTNIIEISIPKTTNIEEKCSEKIEKII